MAKAGFKPTPELLALWYQALDSEFGIELKVSDLIIINDLYASRTEAKDPKLDALMLTQMKDGTLWLLKKEVNLDE